MHEASLYEGNSFVTLTYDEDHLPSGYSLDYKHFQDFLKRLRKRFSPVRIRHFTCGEYGSVGGRPHFHSILFGCVFSDRVRYKGKGDHELFTSATLDAAWHNQGLAVIGAVTFESAQYVAKYCVTKKNGDGEDQYYNVFDVSSGEIMPRTKEFAHMSLRPGIGADWLRLYWQDIADGTVVVNGKKGNIPRYYRKYLSRTSELDEWTFRMYNHRQAHASDFSDERLKVREAHALALYKASKREL
jgi:hypothetical protein